MTILDRYLQNRRIAKAKAFIRRNDRILDIGSADGVMFEKLKSFIAKSVGIDPTLKDIIEKDFYTLYPGYFPEAFPEKETFNIITMLAVLEHIPTSQQAELALNCHRFLKPNGRLIITVPSPQVDHILEVLLKLRLIDGMSLEEHFGFKPEHTEQIFKAPFFKLIKKKKFQLGLNNLFVFERLET